MIEKGPRDATTQAADPADTYQAEAADAAEPARPHSLTQTYPWQHTEGNAFEMVWNGHTYTVFRGGDRWWRARRNGQTLMGEDATTAWGTRENAQRAAEWNARHTPIVWAAVAHPEPGDITYTTNDQKLPGWGEV